MSFCACVNVYVGVRVCWREYSLNFSLHFSLHTCSMLMCACMCLETSFTSTVRQRSLYLVVGCCPPSSWNKLSNSLRYDLLRISLFLLHKRLTNNFVRLRSHCAEAF